MVGTLGRGLDRPASGRRCTSSKNNARTRGSTSSARSARKAAGEVSQPRIEGSSQLR